MVPFSEMTCWVAHSNERSCQAVTFSWKPVSAGVSAWSNERSCHAVGGMRRNFDCWFLFSAACSNEVRGMATWTIFYIGGVSSKLELRFLPGVRRVLFHEFWCRTACCLFRLFPRSLSATVRVATVCLCGGLKKSLKMCAPCLPTSTQLL